MPIDYRERQMQQIISLIKSDRPLRETAASIYNQLIEPKVDKLRVAGELIVKASYMPDDTNSLDELLRKYYAHPIDVGPSKEGR